MSFERPLRGGCQCGRNQYIVQFPQHAARRDVARVLFNSHPTHRVALASPLAAFLRVPLDWYHSCMLAMCPDETSAMIRRVYTSPDEQHAQRQFCGYCGTPLTYFCDHPRSEADYIHLTLGSLHPEDLGDLEEMGFLGEPEPDADSRSEAEQLRARTARASLGSPGAPPASGDGANAGSDLDGAEDGAGKSAARGGNAPGPGPALVSRDRDTLGGLPWLDTLLEGSRLGSRVRSSTRLVGSSTSRDGSTVRLEWEVTEWTDGADDGVEGGKKRKLDERDDAADVLTKGIKH